MITKFKCGKHKRYKGVRRPLCGCFCCWIKYRLMHRKPERKPKVLEETQTNE